MPNENTPHSHRVRFFIYLAISILCVFSLYEGWLINVLYSKQSDFFAWRTEFSQEWEVFSKSRAGLVKRFEYSEKLVFNHDRLLADFLNRMTNVETDLKSKRDK